MSDVPDLHEYRQLARGWLEENVERRVQAPGATPDVPLRAARHYTREQIDAERPKQRMLYDAGYAGITVPVAYGGQGLTSAHERVFEEEARGYAMPNFDTAGRTTNVCVRVALAHASEAFKVRHLPKMLAGEELWVQLFSEPGAGSDLAGVRTRATRDGEMWILNGAKVWTTFAHLADWGLCLARTDWEQPKHRGLTWFGVPLDAPGITLRVIRQITGGGDFCEEFLDDVQIPDTERIGEVDDGWTVARTMLVFERGASKEPAPDVLAPGPLASDLVASAHATGRATDPHVRQLIARGHSLDFLYETLRARVGQALSVPGANGSVAAYGKLAHGVFEAERAEIALRVAGGRAVAWTEPDDPGAVAATAYLNGRILSIAGGTQQMQRNAISEQVLGLPREPSADHGVPFAQVLRDAAKWGS